MLLATHKDVLNIIQSKFSSKEVVKTLHLNAALVQKGWIDEKKILAIVQCDSSYAVFVIISDKEEPESFLDLTIERVVPIDQFFSCDTEPIVNNYTNILFNIIYKNTKLEFNIEIGFESSNFASEVIRCKELSSINSLNFDWLEKYSVEEMEDNCPDIVVARQKIAQGQGISANRESYLRSQLSVREHEYTHKQEFTKQSYVSIKTLTIIFEKYSNTMTTDWVHCNSCYTRYKSSIKFNFTSCGHILCEKCLLEMGNKISCVICKSQFECIPISHNLDPQLECYFRPAQVHLEKSKQILNFQHNNALSLLKYVTQKYNYAKAEILRVYKSNKELKKENEMLKRQLARPSIMSSNRGGFDSNSRQVPSNFSMNGSDGTMNFNNHRRSILQQGPSLWNQHGVGRPMGMPGAEAASSFESQDVSAVSPSRGSGYGPSSIHRQSFQRVRPSPMLPMSHLHLRSGKGNPEQKYKR